MAYSRLPSRYQFEASSGTLDYSQKYNCNPTVMTAIAQFYRDAWLGIEPTRRLAGIPPGRPTTYTESQLMLAKRGVVADIMVIETLAELQMLVRSGRRPVGIGVFMDRVPASIRGHSFRDWHMIGVRSVVTNDSGAEIGFDVMDPNFYPPGGPRTDPTEGHRYYNNSVMNYAFIQGERKLAIVPRSLKPLPPAPAPAPKPIVDDRADGDPAPMRFRTLVNQDTGAVKLLKIKDRKPYRHGASTGSKIAKYAPPGGEPIVAVGRIPAADVEAKWPGQGKYGDVWIVPSYLSNGEHFFYVKAVDATNR